MRIGDSYLRLTRAQKSAVLPGGASRVSAIDFNLVRSSPGQGRVGVYLANNQLTAEPGSPLTSAITHADVEVTIRSKL